MGVKLWKCAKCGYKGTRQAVRKHLRDEEHINRKAKFYGRNVGHKGNRLRAEKDTRSIVTQNCILVKEI